MVIRQCYYGKNTGRGVLRHWKHFLAYNVADTVSLEKLMVLPTMKN